MELYKPTGGMVTTSIFYTQSWNRMDLTDSSKSIRKATQTLDSYTGQTLSTSNPQPIWNHQWQTWKLPTERP